MTSSQTVERDAWDAAAHDHCRCGARLLLIETPWNERLCLECGLGEPFCRCLAGVCESCGWGPTT